MTRDGAPTGVRRVAARLRRGNRAADPSAPPPAAGSTADRTPERADVVVESTHVGAWADELAARLRANAEPAGRDPDYDLLRDNFDYLHVVLQDPTLQDRPDTDPVREHLATGGAASPSPDPDFHAASYLERHPERRDNALGSPYLAWLKEGRGAGEIADPGQGIERMAAVVGLDPHDVVDELVTTRADTVQRLRTGPLGEMFAKAVEIEPLIGEVWGQTASVRMMPLQGPLIAGQVSAIHECQASAGGRTARVVVTTDGSGERLNLPDALAQALLGAVRPEDLLVVRADPAGHDEGRRTVSTLPDGVRVVDFGAAAVGLPPPHRQLAFLALLRSFGAEAIVNAGSLLFYRILVPYGRALAASERVFLSFVDEPAPTGVRGRGEGTSLRWLYAGLDVATGFVVADDEMKERLVEHFQLDAPQAEMMHSLGDLTDPAHAVRVLLDASREERSPGD